MQVRNWFKSLTVAEKSVTLTTVDKDLVNMFKAMHAKYVQNGRKGKFTANTNAFTSTDADLLESVHPYQILLVKPKNELSIHASKFMQEKQQSEDMLIEGVRIVSVQSQNDTLTLDPEIFENTEFFMKIMKSVDDRFLMKNKDINKVPYPVDGSLLIKSNDSGF